MSKIGRVHSFQSFSSAHGPGTRFVIFLQGCPLRCLHCQEKETLFLDGGKPYSAEQVIAKAIRYKEYWGKDGGITVSGGEPLLQPEFVDAIFMEAKKRGLSTCLETSGAPFTHEGDFFFLFNRVIEKTDLILVNLKSIDEEKAIEISGKSPLNSKNMLAYLSSLGKRVWINYPLIPGVTDQEEDLEATAIYLSSFPNIEKVNVIPYPFKDYPSPTPSEIEKARKRLSSSLL